MTWTFYFLLMACLLIPTVIVGISDSIEKEERPAVARRSPKERRKAERRFPGRVYHKGEKKCKQF